MSVLVLVSNITPIFHQDYVSSSCGDGTCLSLCFHTNMSKKIQEETEKITRIERNRQRRGEGEKKGINKGKGAGKREKTGTQQCRVVARRPREQHDTEAGRIQAAMPRKKIHRGSSHLSI